MVRTGVLFQLKSGRTSAPRLPHACRTKALRAAMHLTLATISGARWHSLYFRIRCAALTIVSFPHGISKGAVAQAP